MTYRKDDAPVKQQLDLLVALFDHLPMGIAVFDRNLRLRRCNRAWAEFMNRYSPHSDGAPVRGIHYSDLVTDPDPLGDSLFGEALNGKNAREEALRVESGDRVTFWDVVAAPLSEDGRLTGVLNIVIDATDRVRAEDELRRIQDRLEKQADDRTAELQRRLAFENLISTISADFINRAPEDIDKGINEALQGVGEFMDVDRSYVFLYSTDRHTLRNTHEWCAPGVGSQIGQMQDLGVDSIPWSHEILMQGEVLHIPAVADLPSEADADRRLFDSQSDQSLVAVPMRYRGETIGLVGFDAVRKQRTWSEDSIKLLEMLATILVNALSRKRAHAIQEGQRHFLELLATGGSFHDTLHTLVSVIEEQWPGMQGLVLLLDKDGEHLHRGAAVSLPEEYVESIEGLQIGPMVGSCGTASYLGERVIVEDIAEDPRWDNLRELAMKYGLRACWSEPVFSPAGKTVGTFAMYYRHPRSPTEAEIRTIELGAHLAGVAIERKRMDEALQESERMLSTLISNLPGMAYRGHGDRDRTMEFVSQGSTELTGYGPEELIDSEELSYGDLIHPEDREEVWENLQAALKEHRPFELRYRLSTRHGERWVSERGQGVYSPHGTLEALEGFVSDVTERVAARRHLEQHVAERTHELSTLLDVSQTVASTLELKPLLGLILDQLGSVVGYDAASVMTLEGEQLQIVAYRGPIPSDEALDIRFAMEEASVNRAVIHRGEPVLIPDVRGDGELATAFRATAGEELETTFDYIRSWMGVPLIIKDRPIGMLALDHSQPAYYTQQLAAIAQAFASHAATAMENARLYEAEQARLEESERRRGVAEGLRDILAVLNTDRPLMEVLDTIVGQACRLLRSQAGAIYSIDMEDGTYAPVASCRMPDGFMDIGTMPLISTEPNRPTLERRTFAVPDIQARLEKLDAQDLSPYPGLQAWVTMVGDHYKSSLAVPIVVRDEVYGYLALMYEEGRTFSDEDISLATTLADQAALAIENARLRVEAEKSAAAAERSRLARDLHDAVTQTLFSASLIADVLPTLWEKNPEQGHQRLGELRELTRGALAEMRTLLLELRPTALTDTEMNELLRQLAESITGRARVPVDVHISGECQLPVEVKVALYRIAQESLNNVAKHSGATQATVELRCQDDVELEITDDGTGFDVAAAPPESLGLGIMRERAKDIDADLTVTSSPDEGTRVHVAWTRPTNS